MRQLALGKRSVIDEVARLPDVRKQGMIGVARRILDCEEDPRILPDKCGHLALSPRRVHIATSTGPGER
jgi:hypothetical protein